MKESLLMLKQEMGALLKETGHALGVEDFDSLLRVYELAKQISSPRDEVDDLPLCAPAQVGNVLLHPLTLGRSQWLQERGLKWFGDSSAMSDIVFAWLLARVVDLPDLWKITTRFKCKRAVKKWWRHADCSFTQLEAGLEALVGAQELDSQTGQLCRNCEWWNVERRCENEVVTRLIDGEFMPKGLFGCGQFSCREEEKGSYYGPMLALLCREYGGTPDYWLWDAPLGTVNQLWSEYLLRLQAEEDAAARASAGPGRKAVAPPPTMRARQLRQLRLLKNEIREKWLTEN